MKILAIETSCEQASVAVLSGDEILERHLEGHAGHSERLLPTLCQLLAEAGIGLSALDAVAFGAGPGAFTGLRLACGVAQGLALGAGLGIAAVPSLAALALQGEGERVFAASDARMGEVYFAAYRVNDGVAEAEGPIRCAPPTEVRLPEEGRWFAVGSALKAYEPQLLVDSRERLCGWNAAAVPRARHVAQLARGLVREGALLVPEAAAPLYVRDKVALTTAERLARGGKA